jgi:hypothetical protein
MPIAASSSVADAHPGVDRRQPQRDRQEERDDEEDAGLHQVLEEEHDQPAGQLRRARHADRDERLPAAPRDPDLPPREEPQREQPAQQEPDHGRAAEPLLAARLRGHPAPLPGAQDAEHDQPEPERGQRGADQVDVRPRVRRRVLDPARQGKDRDDDDDLPGEHEPPRRVRRREPADQRADGNGARPGRGDEAVGLRPLLEAEVAGDQRDDRRQDQRGADALEERPAEQEHRQALRERGRQRPQAVDHAPDREGPLPAYEGADLAAGDHQHRHHQRVGRDGALDPGNGRSHVVGDRRDRDVHDRAVERHQELPGGERQQDRLRGRTDGGGGGCAHARALRTRRAAR